MCIVSVPSSCTTGNINLGNGDSEMEGRVEVCRGGVWGAVYDSTGWNFNDAQVTCRQLGYPSECELVCTCKKHLKEAVAQVTRVNSQQKLNTV